MELPTAAAALGAAAAMGASGLGYGALIPPPEEWEDGIETRWALGLGILGSGVLALGLAGVLRRVPVALLVLGGLALLVAPGRARRLRAARRPAAREAIALLALLPSLAVSLVPPTFYDCAAYHLAFPQAFLASGDVAPRPESFYSFFPLQMEMLFTGALSLSGVEESAAPLHLLVAALAVLSTAGLARELGGKAAGPWGAAVAVASPALLMLAALPKNDLMVALFLMVALRAGLELQRTGRLHAALPLGIGWALATKHSAIYQCAFLVLLLALAALRAGRRPAARRIALALLLAGITAGPWYLRSYAASGNPIYPAMESVFGTASFQRAGFVNPVERRDLPLRELPRVLRDVVTGRPGWGSFSNPGALLLPAALAGALFAPRGRGVILAWGLLSLLAWAKTFNQARFLLPVALALGALGGAGIASLVGARPRLRLPVALAVAFSLAGALLAFAVDARTYVDPAAYLAGREGREGYLARVLRPYTVFRAANEQLPPDARVLFVGETRTLYMKRAVLANSANDRTTIVEAIRASADLPALLRRLRGERFTHVLVNPAEIARLEPYGPYLHFAGDRERALYAELVALLKTRVVAKHRGVYLAALPPVP